MSTINYGFQSVPEDSSDERDHRRRMARAIQALMLGKSNCTLDVTLNANAATTTIQDPRISATSAIVPAMATTAHAATALAAGIYVTSITGATAFQTGSAVINHNNTVDTDKTIRFLILG